jgi:ribose 5-phosphate isomerase B
MKISLGSDHAGFRYKEAFRKTLQDLGHEVVDCGTDSEESTDYPLFIIPAAEAVGRGECERGIVFGGSGNGEAIAANKVKGVRCALCWNTETAEFSRRHNDANVLSIGQRMISLEIALDVLKVWLETPFDGGRHANRLAELTNYENGEGLHRVTAP